MNMQRRKLFGLTLAAASAMCLPGAAFADEAAPRQGGADVIQSIKTRRSVRAYTDEPVSDADLQTILECAMLAPSAANEQPWEFVVVRDKNMLQEVGAANHYAAYAAHAPLAILVCLNTEKEKVKGMGILDVAIACENMLLAAHALGLGGVFTGIYPMDDRIAAYRKLFGLPDSVTPVGLLIFGHPKTQTTNVPDRYNPAAVHNEKWAADQQ